MHLSALFIYPVKSLRGCQVTTCEVDTLGLAGDRRLMVIDETGRFLTQRVMPTMALIDATLSGSLVTLSLRGHGTLQVSTVSDPKAILRTVSVWSSAGLVAEDCGDTAAEWLSSALGARCRLVRIGAHFRRETARIPLTQANDLVAFADAYPFLVLGEASLADLNDRLLERGLESSEVARFRPNLVISESAAYAEDRWTRFRVGNVTFRTTGPCARCTVPTIDYHTGERGAEPLRTLAAFRRNPADSSEIIFGQNAVHETKSGSLRVGDRVELL